MHFALFMAVSVGIGSASASLTLVYFLYVRDKFPRKFPIGAFTTLIGACGPIALAFFLSGVALSYFKETTADERLLFLCVWLVILWIGIIVTAIRTFAKRK